MRKKTKLIYKNRKNKPTSINTPLMRASTILFDSTEQFLEYRKKRETERILTYGVRGTETHFELERCIAEMEGGYGVQLTPTGLSALITTIGALVNAGGHIIISEGLYKSVKDFLNEYKDKFNYEFDIISANMNDLEEKIKPNTQLILGETPSSMKYEIVDVTEVSKITKKHNIPLAIDNTYSSGYLYNPIKLGADISVISATKYLGGHSDIVMGAITSNKKYYEKIFKYSEFCGITCSADDAYMVLRGIRSMASRLHTHQHNASIVLDFLKDRKEIKKIYHPELSSGDFYDIWKRDFKGHNGLISIELGDNYDKSDAIKIVDNLKIFGIGSSWGGYESLAMYSINDDNLPLIRFHIGLEDPQDLIDDMVSSFSKI